MRLLLILLLTCTQAIAKPIFGEFLILPVKAPDALFASQLQDTFLDILDDNEFENVLTREDLTVLSRVKARGTKKDYEVELRNTLSSKTPDLIFEVKVDAVKEDSKKLSLTIKNKDKQNIFYRESIFDYETLSEFQRRLSFWMDEFKNILPPVGEVQSISDGRIRVKIVHGSSTDKFVNRPFHIGKFNYRTDFSYESYEKMGAITGKSGSSFEGYIYSKFRSKNVSKGDHILFLRNEDFALKNKERISKSETYFNYLNSPQFSLLDCTLLPIVGNLKNNKLFYEQLSQIVVENKLCKYRDDKNIDKILSKYEGQLEEYLNNEVVLSNLANILRVGALFRLGIHKVVNGVSVKFDVISENGKNIYYSKFTIIEEYDEDYIAQLLLGWIIDYKKTLPLTGRIIQIRGENLLIDIPAGLVEGTKQEFSIKRPISLVYEELNGNRNVTWKTKTIAYGTVDSIRKNHSIGTVFKFANKESKIREGDWVYIEDLDFQIKKDIYLIKKHNVKSERNIGAAKLSTEFTSVAAGGNTETIFGVGLGLDFYLPFGFLLTGEAVRNLSGGDQSISNNNFKYALGYSFTPRIYDYFALVDIFVGQRIVNYDLEGLDARGIGDLKYDGYFAGVRTEVPIYKKFSLEGQFNYAPSDEVENSNTLFGNVEKSNGFELLLTGIYKLKKDHRLYVEYHNKQYDTTYEVDGTTVSIQSNLIKVGYGITF